MDWVRGAAIGQGSSAVVYLGFHRSLPSAAFAVKSTFLSSSSLLQQEETVLMDLQGCPQIIRCFGHDITTNPSGKPIYNLFLEYANGGCISGALPEPTIRRYVRSILFSLRHIHNKGYVHCDIKPDNILIVDGEAKISDFGLVRRAGEESTEVGYVWGTPLYMAPESAAWNEYNTAADIWALGCSVSQMASGRLPWPDVDDTDYGIWPLLFRIGCSDELPEIPPEISEEGKDFLRCCLQREPNNRWTAEMLLRHPFMASSSSSEFESKGEAMACSIWQPTPRSELGYRFANSVIPRTPPRNSELLDSFPIIEVVREMMRELTTENRPDWEEEEGRLTVREKSSNGRIGEEIILPDESIFYT